MAEVYLALGSNLGDSDDNIEHAKQLLTNILFNVRSANIYTSKPIGYTKQPDFRNTVVYGKTNLSPTELLDFVKSVESQVGRTKTFRWGPREIDIDIIFYDNVQLDTNELIIPHPSFAERDFVLRPLCDLSPKLCDPRSGMYVEDLLKNLPKTSRSII